jgi:hypothetical protein
LFIFFYYVLGGAGYGVISEVKDNKDRKSQDDDDKKTFYEKGSLFAYRMLQESV